MILQKRKGTDFQWFAKSQVAIQKNALSPIKKTTELINWKRKHFPRRKGIWFGADMGVGLSGLTAQTHSFGFRGKFQTVTGKI